MLSGLFQENTYGGGGGSRYFLDGLWYLGENLFLWVVVLWENILARAVVLSVNDKKNQAMQPLCIALNHPSIEGNTFSLNKYC